MVFPGFEKGQTVDGTGDTEKGEKGAKENLKAIKLSKRNRVQVHGQRGHAQRKGHIGCRWREAGFRHRGETGEV